MMKWEYTTDKKNATLTNITGKVVRATILYKEDSIHEKEKYYLHCTVKYKNGNTKEINQYFGTMATAQSYVRDYNR